MENDFSNFYKRVIVHKSDDFLSLDFQIDEEKNSFCQSTHIDFVNNKLLYSGDYGTYVFGKNIQGIKTFFKRDEPNYQYWREKLEAYSENPDLNEYDNIVDIIEKVTDYFKDYGLYYDSKKDYSDLSESELEELKEKSKILEGDLESSLFFVGDYSVDNVVSIVKNVLSDFQCLNDYEDEYILEDCDLYDILEIRNDYTGRFKRLCNFCCWVENNLDEWLKITGDNGTIYLKK